MVATQTIVCPFCKGAVRPDLVRAGGNCPHCMLEIPGEEAPTDPGLEMRQKQAILAAAARKRSVLVRRLMGGVALMFVAGVGVSGWWYQRLQAEELVYEMDDVFMAPGARTLAAPSSTVQATPSARQGSSSKANNAARITKILGQGGEETTSTVGVNGSGATGNPSVKFVPAGQAGDLAVGLQSQSGPVSRLGNVDIGVGRVGGDVIKDDDLIFAMAKEAINAYSPQVDTCVQQRLKVDESFAGAWRVEFTIQTTGQPKGVRVTGVDRPDPELEGCVTRAVSSWAFARIGHDFKVKKTYHFTGSSW